MSAICPAEVPQLALGKLLPEEEAYSATLADTERRREWTAGRLCLIAALDKLDACRQPILSAPSGAPTMPAGIAGSISHKGPFTAAAVHTTVSRIGLDVECVEDTDARLLARVLAPKERAGLTPSGDLDETLLGAMYFAAKEAVYKAADPTIQTELDFAHIELESRPERLLQSGVWVHSEASVRGSHLVSLKTYLDGRWIVAIAAAS